MQADPAVPEGWVYPLVRKAKIANDIGESTPFVFNDRLYRCENFKEVSRFPGEPIEEHFHEDGVRIRDVETDEIISTPLMNHYFGITFVWAGVVYLYAGYYGVDTSFWNIENIVLLTSDDLVHWSEPRTVIESENDEFLYNVAVCRDNEKFVLLYETNDARWPPFTFKFCVSDDLVNWTRIPGAIFGRDKYVGGPALYYEGGRYYVLYLHDLGNGWETRVARSTDLIDWEEAPDGRVFLPIDPTNVVDARYPDITEISASDAELCSWKGKTLVYFTGGDQVKVGDFQLAEFDGTPRELLEHFFA